MTIARALGDVMSAPPEISIIVPFRNSRQYLRTSLRAVQSQSEPSWEAFFIDDGSTDEGVELLESLAATDSRILVLRQPPKGVAAARNLGLSRARGRFVAFLDADDDLPVDAYRNLLTVAVEQNCPIVAGLAESRRGGRRWLNPQFQELRNNACFGTTLLASPALARDASACNKLFERALLESHGLRFPEGRQLREELHFVLRAYATGCRVSIVPKVTYHYQLRSAAATASLTQSSSPKALLDLLWVRNDLTQRLETLASSDGLTLLDEGIITTLLYRLPSLDSDLPLEASSLHSDLAAFAASLAPALVDGLTNPAHRLALGALAQQDISAARCWLLPESRERALAQVEAELGHRPIAGTGPGVSSSETQRRPSTNGGRRRKWLLARASKLRGQTRSLSLACHRLLLSAPSTRRLWLLGERRGQFSGDNGWELFQYLQAQRPDIEAYYVTEHPELLCPQPSQRILRRGSLNALDKLSRAEVLAFTDAGQDLDPDWTELADRLSAQAVLCFLQHGVFAIHGGSAFYHRERMQQRHERVELFFASSPRERELLVQRLGHRPETVVATGLARFDALLACPQAPQKTLLVIPTWRPWLAKLSPREFAVTNYFQRYSRLLENAELAQLAGNAGLELVFCAHFNAAAAFRARLASTSAVRVVDARSESVLELLRATALAVSDYSSVILDLALRGAPSVRYTFDAAQLKAFQGTFGIDWAWPVCKRTRCSLKLQDS